MCSTACKIKQNRALQRLKHDKKLIGVADVVICKMCNRSMKSLVTHVIKMHNMHISEYLKTYSGKIVSDSTHKKLSDNMQGERNPGKGHGGKLSPWSENSSLFTPKQRESAKQKAINKHLYCKRNTNMEYFLNKGLSFSAATKALKDRQRTFSLSMCKQKLGDINGLERFKERQAKWHTSYKKSNFSKVSQTLFWMIAKHFDTLEGIYFATLDCNKEKDNSGINNEYRLKTAITTLLPDFLNIKTKKIIEFDGTYWHRDIAKEHLRDTLIKAEGFKVHHVKEINFANNAAFELKKCMDFLNG